MFFVKQGPQEHMSKLMFYVEQESLEHMSTYNCVEWEALENMDFETFLLSIKLWNIWKDKLEVLGISPSAFHADVGHKLSNIGSLAIVSLGVSYKYILSLVLSKDLWNCTKFVTPWFLALSVGSGNH